MRKITWRNRKWKKTNTYGLEIHLFKISKFIYILASLIYKGDVSILKLLYSCQILLDSVDKFTIK